MSDDNKLTSTDRTIAMALCKPVCLSFGYSKYLMEEEQAFKIMDWFRGSPTIYKVDNKYVNSKSIPILKHVDPGEISVGVTSLAYILVGLENAEKE